MICSVCLTSKLSIWGTRAPISPFDAAICLLSCILEATVGIVAQSVSRQLVLRNGPKRPCAHVIGRMDNALRGVTFSSDIQNMSRARKDKPRSGLAQPSEPSTSTEPVLLVGSNSGGRAHRINSSI